MSGTREVWRVCKKDCLGLLSLWCCAAAAVETCAWGQTAVDGAIGGFVVDAGGRALPGAVVQVQSVASGTTARMTTGGRGEFLVGHLPAGEYRVVVDYALFARLTLQPVVVELGGETSIEARLRVGGVATSVTVRRAGTLRSLWAPTMCRLPPSQVSSRRMRSRGCR